MTITAPLPPDLSDPVGHDIENAVIRAAKRRARRRRLAYGVLAGTAAAASVAAFLTLGATPPSPNPPAADPVASEPLVADGPTREARLVAHLRAIHVGWVLVYSDGRVISYPDTEPFWERRLSAHGLELVRSGAVPLNTLLGREEPPPDTWAEPKARVYGTPLGYVACAFLPNSYIPREATEALPELPTAARALLRGTDRTYRVLDASDVSRHGCFELTANQAHALARLSDPLPVAEPFPPRSVAFTGSRGSKVTIDLTPAVPDRVLVACYACG